MVAAVYYFATGRDHEALLDYLGEPDSVALHPWSPVTKPLVAWTRAEALTRPQVMVANAELGGPVMIRPGDAAMEGRTKAGIFNRLNWERLRPTPSEGLVDSNASPVLFWRPATSSESVLGVGDIGSQADSMTAISHDYEAWVRRVLGWIRRRGTKVWGEERAETHPYLDVDLAFVNAVYALPDALRALEGMARGRRLIAE